MGRRSAPPDAPETGGTATVQPGTLAPQERRLAGRLLLGAGLAGVVAVPALGLFLLIEGRYQGLENLDRGVADSLNGWALQHEGVVSLLQFLQAALGPTTFRVLVLLVALALWRAGSRRLASWAVVTTAFGAVLGVVLKQLVHRARPSFPDPVAAAGSFSFPSGHALGSFLGTAVLLLIALPVLRRAGRAVAWALAVGVVVVTGFDRIALGVHFVSDVLAGWFVAAAVLVGTTTAFGAWDSLRQSAGGIDPAGSRRFARKFTEDVHAR